MALLSGLRETRGAVTASNVSPKDPALADLFGSSSNSASGQSVTSETALRATAVYACVLVRSQMIGMFPACVKRSRGIGKGSEVLTGHRYADVLGKRANRWQSAYEWFAWMQSRVDLRGNAYSEIVYHPGLKQNELVPMSPDRVWPFVKTPNGAIYYMYDNSPAPPPGSKLYYQYFPINAETRILEASEVVHIRGFSLNGVVGMDPITRVARETVGLALATEEHGARLFSNGAQIAKVLKHPGKLGQEAFDRMKGQLAEFEGVRNSHKSMVLEEGMDISNLSMTMEAAQFLETRKFQVEEIARIFNVPLMLIGAGDKAPTYASAEQFFMSFKVHTMQPLVTNFEQTLTNSLLTFADDRGCFIDLDMDSMMRADAKSRSEYLKNRFSTASISPNGIRIYEGENPDDGEGSDSLYIMSNMVPLAMAGQNPTKTPSEGEGAAADAA